MFVVQIATDKSLPIGHITDFASNPGGNPLAGHKPSNHLLDGDYSLNHLHCPSPRQNHPRPAKEALNDLCCLVFLCLYIEDGIQLRNMEFRSVVFELLLLAHCALYLLVPEGLHIWGIFLRDVGELFHLSRLFVLFCFFLS